MNPDTDPCEILGVAPDATPDEIRAAYLVRVKEHPPDLCPEEFERIRDAHDLLRDPRRRAESLFVAADPLSPLADLSTELSRDRCHVGPGPWLAALEG